LADGMVTGTATAFGAVIPLIPFLTLPLGAAIWVSLIISMLAHFAVGAARSIFTGRSVWASGRDMFLVGVLVGLAVSVGFVQFMELMLANAIAGRPLQSMEDYAVVLNALPVLGIRLVVTSFLALLGGYLCAKLAEAEEMRYTLIAAIFRILAMAGGSA